jgi:hypothetical protein
VATGNGAKEADVILRVHVEIDARFAPSHSPIRTEEIDDRESKQSFLTRHSEYPGEHA